MTQDQTSGAAPRDVQCRHLTQSELAARWQVSERTIGRWRRLGIAPPALKLHGAVRFRWPDVIDFELSQLRRGSPAVSLCAPMRPALDASPVPKSTGDLRRTPHDPRYGRKRHLELVQGGRLDEGED